MTEPDGNGRPGVPTVVALVCVGILGLVWGVGEVFWGSPAFGLFAIVASVITVCCAVYYHFRVARHLRSGPHTALQSEHRAGRAGTNEEG